MTEGWTAAERVGLGVDLFAYAGGGETAESAAELAAPVDGLVVRRRKGAALAHALRRLGFAGRLLADPALYEHEGPDPDARDDTLLGGRNEDWAAAQRELSVDAYLSPSPYVPTGRADRLRRAVADGERFCELVADRPAYVVLAVGHGWLTRGGGRLASAAASCRWPVALVLAAEDEPLKRRDHVDGLTRLLSEAPGTLLLRSDVCTLGGLAHGAAGAAYGTGWRVRQGWPPGGRQRPRPTAEPVTFVPRLLTHVKTAALPQLADGEGWLECYCRVCGGRSVARFDDPDEPHQRRHEIDAWRMLAVQVLFTPLADGPPGAWRALCADALTGFSELERPGGVRLDAPAYLSAWTPPGG